VESKNRDDGGFDRQSVILFADDLQEFLKGFDDSLRIMEKEVRERKKQERAAAHDTMRHDTTRHGKHGDKPDNKDKPEHPHKPRGRPARQDGSREGKRVVVKKV
jgi:hypothetical protein